MNIELQNGPAPRRAEWWRSLQSAWRRLDRRSNQRQLRLREILPLGEKRFVAVVQFEAQQFLIGGSVSTVSLLARLDKTVEFSEAPSGLGDVYQ